MYFNLLTQIIISFNFPGFLLGCGYSKNSKYKQAMLVCS